MIRAKETFVKTFVCISMRASFDRTFDRMHIYVCMYKIAKQTYGHTLLKSSMKES